MSVSHAHIQHIEETRAELIREAMPPARLFDVVFAGPEMLNVGARFNRTYARTLRKLQTARRKEREVTLARHAAEESRAYLAPYDAETQEGILRRKFFEDAWRKLAREVPSGGMGAAEHAQATRLADEQLRKTPTHRRAALLYERVYTETHRRLEREFAADLGEEDHAALRERMEGFLAQWPEEQHTAILRGAMVSVHLGRSQSAQAHGVWLLGPEREDGTRAPGIAQKSLAALREIGLLEEVDQTQHGVIVYPGAEVQEPIYRTIGLQGVWANWYQAYAREMGWEVPENLAEISSAERAWAKQQVAQLTGSAFQGMTLEIRREGKALAVYTERGNKVGTLSRDSHGVVREGEQLYVCGALARDGNLRVAIE